MRKGLSLTVLAMGLLLSLMDSAQAGGVTLTEEAEQVARITVNPDFRFDDAGRRTFARTLLDYCAAMLSSIPTNTPDEQRWAEDEANPRHALAKSCRLLELQLPWPYKLRPVDSGRSVRFQRIAEQREKK